MQGSKKIKAVLFDLDGTLRDSRQAIHPAFQYTLKVHGIDADADGILDHVHSLRAVHQAVASHVNYDDLLATYDKRIAELWHTIVLYEHVHEVLQGLKDHGYKVGLVSSSRSATKGLADEDLTKFFDVVITGLDTENHKPHPEPVLMALEKLGTPPKQSVMVGDLPVDILAGKAAGAATIGITHGFGTREALEQAGADYIIGSLADLPEVIDTIE